MSGRYKDKRKLTSVIADRTIAAGETKVVGWHHLNHINEARFMTIRVRASTRAGGGTVTAKLYHAMTKSDTPVDTGLSVVIAAADTDYYITQICDPTGTAANQPLLLMPYLEVQVDAVTGNAVMESVDFTSLG